MTPENALPDASPRSLLLNQMNEGQQEAQKHQQSDSPNEQSGTEIMITNRARQGVSLPKTVGAVLRVRHSARDTRFPVQETSSAPTLWPYPHNGPLRPAQL